MSDKDYFASVFRQGEIVNSKSYFNSDGDWATLFTIIMPDTTIWAGKYHVKTINGEFAGFTQLS